MEAPMERRFDRTAEDLGNIAALEQVNVGRSQFHLPTSPAQVLRGHTGIVVPSREALVRRLERTRKRLEGTRFDFSEHEEFVEATCPWGNRIRCYAPDDRLC